MIETLILLLGLYGANLKLQKYINIDLVEELNPIWRGRRKHFKFLYPLAISCCLFFVYLFPATTPIIDAILLGTLINDCWVLRSVK